MIISWCLCYVVWIDGGEILIVSVHEHDKDKEFWVQDASLHSQNVIFLTNKTKWGTIVPLSDSL
jgi:hypothetical protein